MKHRILLLLVAIGTLATSATATAAPPLMVGSELAAQSAQQSLAPSALQIIPGVYGGLMPQRAEPPLTTTPQAACDAASRPEPGLQGRVPAGSKQGFSCNAELVGHEGVTGGFKVERYVDKAGHVCAYYDTALIFPLNVLPNLMDGKSPGVAVLDMSDPSHPKRTATLTTPAMVSPHESLLVNQRRGLLGAAVGSPGTAPGWTDIYALDQDCRHPVLQSSTPLGLLGHESGFAPDGNTFYVTSLVADTITAIDVRDPKQPSILWLGLFPSHAMTVSDDGTRGYIAGLRGLQIIDLTEIQKRMPNPQVKLISGLSWKSMSIPQTALPVTINNTKMLVENDEFSYDDYGVLASNGPFVGGARIIDISNDYAPRVISNMRLEVNQQENRAKIAGDPGASFLGQGYASHYCGVPQEINPGIVACSFIASGLRVFDVRDPYRPREIAYISPPPRPFLGFPEPTQASDYAMSRPTFDPARGEVWYSDINAGLYVIRLAKDVWPFATTSAVGLPSTATCLNAAALTIRLKAKGARLRDARVTMSGKRMRVRHTANRLTTRIDLRGTTKTRTTIKVVAHTTRGRTIRETRRYVVCAPVTG